MTTSVIRIFPIYLLLATLISCTKKNQTITFSAIGDVPYSEEVAQQLERNIQEHNKTSESSFVVHLGDIKPGSKPCDEAVYKRVSGMLKEFSKPVYIIPGDNEYNDCDDPLEAFGFWKKHFLHFHERWNPKWPTSYQTDQTENFMWVQNDVLFVGLNIVGGRVHDPDEWNQRLASNAEWLGQLVDENSPKAVVIFGHANMNNHPEKFEIFVDEFLSLANRYKKPILYLQGDGHVWIDDRPWRQQNIRRIQVDAGANILKVTIDTSLDDPFVFNRTP